MFLVFNGDVGLITFYIKNISGHSAEKSIWLDPDFNPVLYQNEGVEIIEKIDLTAETKSDLQMFASRIGKRFAYVGVDFLLDGEGRIFLGELTFSPNDGLMRWTADLDTRLGDMWNLR